MTDPDLRVTLGRLTLKNPVLAASGTFGYGAEFTGSVRVERLGGIVTKTVTAHPREGNPPPRLAVTPSGMLNAVGLQNVGLDAFVGKKLPALQGLPTAVIVSVLAESPREAASMVAALAGQARVDAIELNLSCPNVRHERPGQGAAPRHGHPAWLVAHDPQATAEMIAAAREAAGGKPVIAKLAPDLHDLTPVAQAAERAGADALTLANTYVGMAIDPATRRSRLGVLTGGLSGPAIRPLSLYRVWYTAQTIRCPLIGVGGIVRIEDAVEYFAAGAAAVAVGTAHFADPRASVRIAESLPGYLRRHRLASVRDLRGALDHPEPTEH